MECTDSNTTTSSNYIRRKRLSETDEMTPKKAKLIFGSGKNPVQLLHEKFVKVDYEFTQDGTSHDPKFTVTATLNGRTFFGEGPSKQKAKFQLAVVALQGLGFEGELGEQPIIEDIESDNKPRNVWSFPPKRLQKPAAILDDFTKDINLVYEMPGRDREERLLYTPPCSRSPNYNSWDSHFSSPGNYGIPHSGSNIMTPPQAAEHKFSKLFVNRPVINLEKARAYPVMVLTELFPDMKIKWVEGSGRGDRQFKVVVEVQGRTFFGEGRSKKLAKLNLAKTVLLCMYDIHDFKDIDIASKSTSSERTQLEKKFPLTQLKELVGDDMKIEVVPVENTSDIERQFHATIVVKGVAYESVGKHKNIAKLKAAKKALDSLRPKRISVDGVNSNTPTKEEPGCELNKEIDTSRHPTMVFYEMFRDVQFECTETRASSGLNEYLLEATLEGRTFSAKALSKKKAKLRLVLSALQELRGIAMSEWTSIDVTEAMEDRALSSSSAANHPVVLLLKLNPQSTFEITEDLSECDSATKFKAVVYVGDREFYGEAQNKKTAKTAAARSALTILFGIDPDTYVEETRNDIFTDNEPKQELPVELSNRISDAVQQKFIEIFQGDTQYKVLAGFVLAKYELNSDQPAIEVVSLGTGTKCVTGDQIENNGQTLNDCHGEIIACRGFRQYMYNELLKAFNNDSNGILERNTNNGRYSLKAWYRVYLYINTAPCGDGRVFTLQNQSQGARNKTAGLLRTKIENGQGTIPVPENSIQTSDGILEGERLRTMSCSDKILKWNVLGVQGALLSCFLEPVYLEGIVIGLLYNYVSLNRALYARALKIEDGPPGFVLHKPKLGSPNNIEAIRDTSKSTSNSFNWYKNQPHIEAVNASTGKTVVSTPSRLCKLNFFDKFMQAVKTKPVAVNTKTYHDAKASAKDYQRTKELLYYSLEETTCGKWIGKPYEHDRFGY